MPSGSLPVPAIGVWERLERWARGHPRGCWAGLFLLALAFRLSFLALASAFSGLPWRDLALYYDGHVYLLISKSYPRLYVGIHEIFPAFRNSEYFTGWFPFYPLLIRLAGFVIRDSRVSALAVSQIAAALSVVLLYRLARLRSSRPLLAAALYIFFPPTWVLTGSLNFVEPVFVCLFLAAFDRFLAEDMAWAVVFASLVMVTQKSGFLILLVMLAVLVGRHGPRGLRMFLPYLASVLPLALMQGYLGLRFHEFWINLRVQREIFGGPLLQLPGVALARGLFSSTWPFPGPVRLRRELLAASVGFYAAVLAASWVRLRSRQWALVCWLGVVLAFNLCLAGPWACTGFARFMTLAAPAAILLAVELPDPATRLPALALCAAAGAAALVIGTWDLLGSLALIRRAWPAGYFESLATYL